MLFCLTKDASVAYHGHRGVFGVKGCRRTGEKASGCRRTKEKTRKMEEEIV